MASMKAANKLLAEQVTAMKKKYDSSADRRIDIVGKLEQRVIDLQKKHDEIKLQIDAKSERLELVQKHIDTSDNPEKAPDDEKTEMTDLENKLEKVLIKTSEGAALRKIYEQILKAMSEERNQFDQQLLTFERTLKTKRQDAAELEQMGRDALAARDNSRMELSRFENRILEERKHREREISRLKEIIRARKAPEEKADKKSKAESDEVQPVSSSTDKLNSQEIKEKVNEMENTLAIVKENTGIDKISDLLVRMKDLRKTNENLISLKAQYEQQLEALRKQKAEFSTTITSPIVSPAVTSSAISASSKDKANAQDELVKARAELSEARNELDKLTNITNRTRVGVSQLYDRLEGVNSSKPNLTAASEHSATKIKEEELAGAMSDFRKKLSNLAAHLKQKEQADGEIPLPTTTIVKAVLPTHNVRVNLKQLAALDDSDGEEENEHEVLDREML
eukprot:Partr_v1_DN26982_c0_g1_i2_m7066 putative Coiled-coil domain containing 151